MGFLEQVHKTDSMMGQQASVRVLAGNTAAGIYHEWPAEKTIVSIRRVQGMDAINREKVSSATY